MKRSVFILLSVLVALSTTIHAASIGGIELPRQQGELKLQGAGLLKKGYVFKIYVGALYLENTNDARRVLSEVPKRIDIYYFRHTPKKHMVRVANETLKNNLGEQKYAELQPKIEKIHTAYRDGKKGSRASILYQPGEGLTYLFDNESVITIAGDEFANAYFQIWLGEQPSSKTLKKAMLKHD